MISVKLQLYYIHDPMCSWCWAFRPVWTEIKQALPDSLEVKYLLGGLAADSDVPMAAETQSIIRKHWQTIEKRVPGTRFNYDFWVACQPRRSTYPACRAVIAARQQNPELEDAMIASIQQAYYLQARNPSDDDVLIDLASGLNLDGDRFRHDLTGPETAAMLIREIQQSRRIGAQGFPSLILEKEGRYRVIPVDYNDADIMIRRVLNFR